MPRLIFPMLMLMSVRYIEQHFAQHILDAVIHVSQTCKIKEKKLERGEKLQRSNLIAFLSFISEQDPLIS